MRQLVALGAVGSLVLGLSASGAHAQAGSERFVVSGVILFDNGGGLAWVAEPSITGGRSVPVRVNESVGTYKVTQILGDRVELEGPAGTVLIPVYNAQASAAAAAAAAQSSRAEAVASPAAAGSATSQPATPSPAPAQQAIRSQADASALSALRERLESARRLATQSAPSGAAQPGSASQVGASPSGVSNAPATAPGQSATNGEQASASQGASSAPRGPMVGSNNVPGVAPGEPLPAPSPKVVYPPKGQTFQGILGLTK